jgi:CubicO group peptidase (beta-lactamase class C family)
MTPDVKRLATPLLLLLSVQPFAAHAQSDGRAGNQRLIDALRGFIPEVMRQDGTPGLNIAVARGGKIIWEEGFGLADVAKKTPMTPATVMHSGSMGKTYTATAVMQLVERGVMKLHDPINLYMKGFRVLNPLGEREITVYDLLTHRSGLAQNDAGSDFSPPKPLQQHIKEGYARPTFGVYAGTLPRWGSKVGERFTYSNFGLATLGYLVEVTNPEGLSFSEYVQKHIIDPLGMTSTQYPPVQDAAHIRPDILARMSTGYAHFGNIRIPTPAIYFADYPAGTVVTTPGDHIKLLLAYLSEGTYNGYQLLKPETVRLMLTPQLASRTQLGERDVGLIWGLRNYSRPDFDFEHAGAHMFGWYNDFRAYPKLGFAVAIAVNRWDMVLMTEPTWRTPHVLIADFIASWIQREQAGTLRAAEPTSWAWKTSYVVGLSMVEQLMGLLATTSPLTPEMIEAMATKGTEYTPAAGGQRTWDPAGFRAGVADMLAQPMTREGIQAFLRSNRLRVLPEELHLLVRELRGRSGVPHFGS